jgi:hypothetical protein
MLQSNLSDHKFFPLHDPVNGEQEVIMTTTTLAQDVSIQQKQVDEIVEEHEENESLPYVQHSSIGHDPFQVCLGFQPLAPIDIALLVASSPTKSSHTQTKEDHVIQIYYDPGGSRWPTTFSTESTFRAYGFDKP